MQYKNNLMIKSMNNPMILQNLNWEVVQKIYQDQQIYEGFVNKKELEDEALENIKEEYGFEEIKDAFDEASVSHQLEVFYGGIIENFIQTCYFLSPNKDNREFIAFLVSGKGQNVMTATFPYMLNQEIFSTRISIRMKMFTASLQHNMTKQKP